MQDNKPISHTKSKGTFTYQLACGAAVNRTLGNQTGSAIVILTKKELKLNKNKR